MRKLVEVTLKDGRIIDVFDNEVSGLKKAGVLKEDKSESFTKEEKETGETKEEKEIDETKKRTAEEDKEAMERMIPSKKRPVNISAKNIKGGRPKKVR